MRHFSRAALCVAALAGLFIGNAAEAAVGGPEAQATLTPSNAVAQVDLVDQSAEAEFVAVIVTDTATTKKTFAAGALLAVQGGQQRDAGGVLAARVFARSFKLQNHVADISAPVSAQLSNVVDVGNWDTSPAGTFTTHKNFNTDASASHEVQRDAVGGTLFTAAGFGSPVIHAASEATANALKQLG